MTKKALLLAMFIGAPAFAQAPSGGASTGVGASKATWTTMVGYFTTAAEQMPEADYAFKPVETVRTFGQIVAHLAGAQNMMCAAALGETQKSEDDIEKSVTTKAGLVAALKASSEYCARAYGMSDAHAAGNTKLFGQDMSRMFTLNLNAVHAGEHYGNLATYMRIKGMVPPSSQPSPAQ